MNIGNMVILKMSKKIGVIAEDASDVAVITEIFHKYMRSSDFSVKRFVGNGCGKLRNKCSAWANMLLKSGCDHILVFHDLDRNDERKLRKELESKVSKSDFPSSIIIIPVEEIEAWLLSDSDAIKSVFGLKKVPKTITDCETIKSPKEYLRDLAWSLGKKRYINAAHNHKIAQKADVSNFLRCKSFVPFDQYIRAEICAK